MRNKTKVFAVLTMVVLALALGSIPAWADPTQITLGPSSQTWRFQGNGSGTSTLTLTACGGKFCRGTAFGSGAFGFIGSKVPYKLISNGVMTVTALSSTTFKVTGPAMTFMLGKGGTLLTGDLSLLDLLQAAKNGMFHYSENANLVITSGSLSSLFTSAGGILDITLKFSSKRPLSSIFGTTKSLVGHISSGALVPTPEPSSLLLFGSGLVVLGGVMRSRIRDSGRKSQPINT